MNLTGIFASVAALACMAFVPGNATAETIKIGVVNTFTGPQASFGDLTDKAFKLYLKQHEKELPAGTKIEILNRDDGGPNPDKAKQAAQDLILRDKVQLMAGAAFTPVAMALAPLMTEAKMPFVITNAGTSVVTTKSPYFARTSFTIWQSTSPLGTWAAKKFKTAYTLVADYSPGLDAEQAFTEAFVAGGGKIAGSVRVPVQTADFGTFLQKVKDIKPDALMVFLPAGQTATSMMKSFADIGLRDAGIKLIGPGDITPDEELPNMGDVALGVTTVHHYSAAATRPANVAFVKAWKAAYGEASTPNFVAAAAWDAMAMMVQAIKEQKGKIDSERTMEIYKHFKNPDSPRGPISINPETHDIVQNEYLREVRKVNGKLANVEIETVATAFKDPWQEMHKKK